MRLLCKRTDDLDDYSEGPAVTAVGRVLAALLGVERNTMSNPANRAEQQCLGHTMASGIRNRPSRPDQVSCGEYWERVQAWRR